MGKEMVKTIEAVFDGTVCHPTEPIALAPNTRVRMTVETMLPAEGKAGAPSLGRPGVPCSLGRTVPSLILVDNVWALPL